MNGKNWKFEQIPLRVRLTAWYVFLFGGTLLVFSSYLYLQLKSSLLQQLDTTLEVTTSQTLNNLVEHQGHPVFKKTPASQTLASRFVHRGFAIRLISPQGKIWDGFGNYTAIPENIPKKMGYITLKCDEGIWRVYNYPLPLPQAQNHFSTPQIGDWLQVAQSLQPITKASEHLLFLTFLGFPLVLIIATLGGLFLAHRALYPIDRIIRTAEAIRPDDFTQRIGHQETLDEVGRLAITLDQMLDRIQAGFERERRFIADAAHELRTPLTVIKGRIEVTLSRDRSVEDYQTTLLDLQQEADRLIRLANGLLFLARLEEQENSHQWQPLLVDLSHLLEILVEQMLLLAEEKQIPLISEIKPNLMILGNSDYLTNLFLNLLDNALKYTPKQGQILIKATHEQQQVKITITNTQTTIPPEHLPHLFDRFYRVEEGRSRHSGGAGLGLAIAYEIAHLHGGSITVESQPQHQTTFTVSLPLFNV